jgi:adenylate cyclase
VAETPKVITPTAMKRARGGAKQPQGRRRMSLASSFKAEGEDKLGRIERMVELLTNIPAARNVDALVGAVVNGTFTLMAPGITAVALWLAPHNKTYTAVDSSNVESSNELGSLFMKRIHEDPAAKVNVKRDDYMMYLGASAKEDDIPEAVMCLPIFSAHGHQQLMGILELRNARPAIMGDKGEFGTDDEELVQAITHQAGTSLDNVFYNNKMAQALQRYEYTQTDMATLKSQLVEAGKNLFEADCVMLARHNEVANTVVMDFSGGRSKTVPSGAGATWTVINSRVELGLPQLSSGNGASLRAEFDFADDEDPGMILHPVIGDGTVMGVIGVFGAGTEVDDELLQLVKLFSAQAATLMKNCELYTNAMSQNAKTKNKLELLDVSKAFASELDQHTLMMTIIEKTRTVLDADRCALFMVDELRNQMWASLHDGTIIRTGRSEGIVGWVATNNQPLNITDAYADARFNTDVDKETGYRTNSILAVPVHDAEKKLTGVIQMINKKGGPFGADDLDMLEMIASQAGVTLNNAAIFDEVKKDQENFNVLMDISKKLSSELNIQKLIQSIMDSAKGLLDCDRSTLFLADHQKNELYSYMADGVGTEIRLPLTAGIAGAVATTNQLINIPDAYEDPRFNQAFDRKTGYKTTSILCVPVMSSKGSLLGVCQMINKGGGGDKDNPVTPNLFFEKSDESLLGAFMSQAAVSIENAQLFEKAMSQKERLESTLASIQNLVMSFDSKGMLTGCNHDSWLEKYFSVTAESIGTKMSFKKWLSDYPEVVKEIKKTMETGVNYESLDSIKVLNEETGEEYFLNYSVNSLIRVAKKDASEGIGGAEDEGGCVLVFEDLSEKKKMTSTLGRYLSGALVDQVLGSGADVLGGVRQKVTILFSDIRSFTTISEGMDAVDLVAMLNDYFTYELDPIFDNGGILDKFIGDAIMACFGVPLVSEDDGKTDACMSCKCALEQLAALEIFNEMRKKERGPDTETFAIGIGLNTNKVVSGNIGSDKRMEYTVIGDGVNLASRLEGITKTVRCHPPLPTHRADLLGSPNIPNILSFLS